MEKFLFILEAILCLIVFVIVVTPRLIDYVYKRNQLKLVKKGYKWLFKTYTKCHKLDDATEIVLVELCETSPLHREMLLVYNYSLGRQAAAKFVEIFYKKVELWDFFKEFLSKKGRYEIDALIKNEIQIISCSIMVRICESHTVRKMSIGTAKLTGSLVHEINKGINTATYMFSDSVGNLIGASYHDSEKSLLKRN